ncbi:prothymosin alpha-B-like [Stylophora pistillata]|uniref:prothymosin alpha-B-like n=1 Tax=Stylophora pistillata TaxID=50429 RepID=UPI000C03D85B|nr:prothymosin alpha-B-like [Stylophora pistillata]
MQSPEAQKRVAEAYHQAECMALKQKIQEIEKNLAAQKEQYRTLLEQRQKHPPASTHCEKERKIICVTMANSSKDLDVFGDPTEEKEGKEPESPGDDDEDGDDGDDTIDDDDGDEDDDDDDGDDDRGQN